MLNEFLPKIPYGTKDLLAREAKQKRTAEDSLARLFSSWGYEEIVTPAFEYLETLAAGTSDGALEYAFRFFDKNNRILALRTDMTTPLARVAATRLRDGDLPFRLFYLANVFRHEEAQAGRQCEFYQAGIELLGTAAPAADAEVAALAVKAMLNLGLENFQIGLGQIEFTNGLMEESELSLKTKQRIKRLMVSHDLVGLGEILEQSGLKQGAVNLLKAIPLLRGGQEVLERAYHLTSNGQSRAALENLSHVYSLLSAYGVQEYINFDFGIIRDFEYYTGLVFEGYTNGLGFPVLGGGRYDNLTASFGFPCPATGFALGLERVLLALERQGINTEMEMETKDIYVGFGEGQLQAAILAACQARAAGRKTQMALAPQTRAAAEKTFRQRGFRELIYLPK